MKTFHPIPPFSSPPLSLSKSCTATISFLKMTGDEGRDGVSWTSAELLLLRRGIRDNRVDDWRTLGDWSKVSQTFTAGGICALCLPLAGAQASGTANKPRAVIYCARLRTGGVAVSFFSLRIASQPGGCERQPIRVRPGKALDEIFRKPPFAAVVTSWL